MKLHAIIGLPAALICSALACAEEPDLGPEAAFYKGLQKLEQQYIKTMREKALKAASVEIHCISDTSTDRDPLSVDVDGEFFTLEDNGYPQHYRISKSGKTAKKPAEIRAWVDAILPAEEQPFAMCIPDYGFAVSFIDKDGHEIYSTRICLKCSSTDVSYPRYNSRLGFDPKVVSQLIKNSGLSVPELK